MFQYYVHYFLISGVLMNAATVCMINHYIVKDDPKLLVNETSKDPVLTLVMHCEAG